MSTMTEAEELCGTFLKLWRAGKNAHLNIECHAGKVWATLRVNLPRPPPPTPQHHHQPHRRVGPSRLRRRERRAASRAQAAVEAAERKVAPATETGNSVKEVKESRTAEQAAAVSVESNPFTNNDVVTVVETSTEEEHKDKNPSTIRPTSTLNVLAQPWSSSQQHGQQEIMTKFDKDEVHQDNHPTPGPQVPSNQCEKCGKTFGSNRALKTHMTKEHELSSA